MQQRLKLIKTLPHLIPWHVSQAGFNVYATAYSPQIVKFLQSLRTITHEIGYGQALSMVQKDGWQRVNSVSEPAEISIKGDSISLWPIGYPHPVRIDFDFEQVHRIYMYDQEYGRKIGDLPGIVVGDYVLQEKGDLEHVFVENLHELSINSAIFIQFTPSIIPDLPDLEVINYDFAYPQLFWSRLDLFTQEVKRLRSQGYRLRLQTHHPQSIPEEVWGLLSTDNDLDDIPPDLSSGFVSNSQKLALFTDREIFGSVYLSKQKVTDTNAAKLLAQFEGEIAVGDYVVHEDYGVAIYAGLTQETIDNELREYLQLKFAGDDEVLVPIGQVNKLTKYIGDANSEPRLSRLGYADWKQAKARVKKSVGILARELISHYAQRAMANALPLPEADSSEYLDFVDAFPHNETEDQLRSTNEILADMQKTFPMNRLLVGDVGFGKTEVMMRAAFKAVEAGWQVAILCPTTVLCAQHFGVFTERFKHSDVTIKYLSRFNSASENTKIVDAANAGKVQIVIGTHALLRSDLKFKKLGLLIVDEEQRFGVAQKEKIKKLNIGVHFLSVSATPIPRTLGMALSSIQDISLITQPPKGRKAIHTEVEKLDWQKVVEAITHELERDGQVYFVHNHVQDLQALQLRLKNLMPSLKVTLAHGQLSPAELDKRLTEFYTHKTDVLLCSTIIENGLDLPNVNTMIVHQAERFGLSQLYQLRGRVGRSDRQAFCYLFYTGKKLQPDPEAPVETDPKRRKILEPNYLKRLQAMAEATELGAGFNVASRDLEIRGAGNLLGAEQHGHISNVGYGLYAQMLAQEVERLKELIK